MTATVSTTLLNEVKTYLGITWTDSDLDAQLTGMIQRGIAYLCAKTGVEASAFDGETVNLRAQELLFNYVLYDRAGSVNVFKENYRSDIIGLRMKWEVENAVNETDAEA